MVMHISERTEIGALREVFTELVISEGRLQAIAETDPAFTRQRSLRGSKETLTRGWRGYTGPSPESTQGPGWEMAFHPDDLDRLLSEWQGILASKQSGEVEVRIRHSDGEYRWFLIRAFPKFDTEGEVVNWSASETGVEDRKRVEERLKLADDELRHENLIPSEEIERASMFEEIVGSSEPMKHVVNQVVKVAPSDATILILGETGSGKELLARAVHRRSKRSAMPFMCVNCAAIPQSLIASELFGHEKGAFTGALQRRTGRFEAADGGTLFLDEIGDLPAETQIALLRVLQEREFERIGSNRPTSVNVRVIAATNRDLHEAIAAKTFRQDLFYRLNVFPIQVPPLRERAADIPLLVQYFIARYGKQAGKQIKRIGNDTLDLFKAYNWPGNIRELQNVVERGVILCEGETFHIDESWLKRESAAIPMPAGPLAALTEREREMIEAALRRCKGRVSGPSGAAAVLKIPRQTLESKIASLGINRYRFRTNPVGQPTARG